MEAQSSLNNQDQTEVKPVLCGVLFHTDRKNDFIDASGCLKPHGHNDSHICETSTGKYMEWEDDYSCECGCWEYEEYGGVCAIYREVPNPA